MIHKTWEQHQPIAASADGTYYRCTGCPGAMRRNVFLAHLGPLLPAALAAIPEALGAGEVSQ